MGWEINSAVTLLKSDDLKCMALNIYHEARNESTAGKVAVAQVVLNRELNPIDSLPTFALSSIKGSTREDILIYIGVSLVGIVMVGVTALVIYLLTIMLTR